MIGAESSIVSQTEKPTIQSLQTEVAHLNQELQMRDQLVQQLSQELFRLVKGKSDIIPHPKADRDCQTQVQSLREQLQGVEEQVQFYQEQIALRDREIVEMRQSVEELTERSRMLEQVVQQLPDIYRQKFAERMTPVKEKVEMLQRENQKLHAELQSVSYRLAVRSRRQSGRLDLPSFSEVTGGDLNLPSLGNPSLGNA
jgi:chromosome segregation ATPase